MLGGPKLRQQLVKLKIRDDFLAEFDRLRKEGAAAFDELRQIGPQGPSEAQHTALKQRLLRVLPDLDDVLKRLADGELSDADLASLALGRPQLAYLRNLVVQYFEIVRNSQWSAPSVRSGRQPPARLPDPEYVVRGLVEVGSEAFEYNPAAPGLSPDQVARQMRQVGYDVTPGGGGVLRLTGGERPLLLLPAGPSVPAPPLARLVTPPGPGAAEVLQKGRTNVAIGLRRVQQQNVVPSLEAILTSIAASDPDTAKALLEGFGRHLPPTETVALQGLANFLQIGGKPQTLAVILGLGNDYGTSEVQSALAAFTRLRASDLAGIEAIVALRGETRSGLDRIVGIAIGFGEPREVFATIGVMAPRTESGLDQLVRQLAGRDAAARRQAYDVMVEGIDIVVRSPTRRLRFERRAIGGQQSLSVRDAAFVPMRGGPAPPSSVYSVTRPSAGDPRVVIRSWIAAGEARAGLERNMMSAGEYAAAELVGWQRAHSQSPGLGGESGEAIRLASELVNQVLQNRGIEGFLRSLRDQVPNERLHLTTETRTHPGTLRLESIHYLVEVPEGNRMRLQFEAAIEMRISGEARAGVRLPGSNKYTFGPWFRP
jgi:hypothetical protein